MATTTKNVRRAAAAMAAGVFLSLAAAPAFAAGSDPWYPEDGDNPLRIVHYFVAPVGTILEWTVTRPLAAVGRYIAPHENIGHRPTNGCSRERPARSCTSIVR